MDSCKFEDGFSHEEELTSLLHDLERRERNNLQVILSLVKLQEASPPATAAFALARVSSQIRFLSWIYDISIDGNGVVDIAPGCENFVSTIAQDLVGSGFVFFSRSVTSLRLLQGKAQTLGFVLVELIADASERALASGASPRIEIVHAEGEAGKFTLRIRDERPSICIPSLAVSLVELTGGNLEGSCEGAHTERTLSFEALAP